MKTRERMRPDESAIRAVAKRLTRTFRLPAIGILDSLRVTLRTMLSKAATVQYPEERIDLPERTRGVIALLEENCTVCMLCAKECPCWCIYIEGHKEQKEGKRKPVNALDRFAIDYGLCMYCGICVEVCPFDALHWSPFFEYTSYTYEGMVHESEVLQEWEHLVPPPPQLVDDADEKLREKTAEVHSKRAEGVWAIIREQDKKDAYLRKMRGEPEAPPQPPPQAQAPAAPQAEAPAAPAAPAPEAAEASAAPAQPSAEATPAPAAADTGDVPRIDPTNLPDGIGPVERGRLKKLAELQHRGEAPTTDPVDLLEVLKPVLDQMKGDG